jgi:predicted XRE-type DNA-binding protein
MEKKNIDVRQAIKQAGLKQWIIADRIGVSEATFTRKLRQELPDKEKQAIYKAIKEVREELAEAN